jgi:hypothetical protein
MLLCRRVAARIVAQKKSPERIKLTTMTPAVSSPYTSSHLPQTKQ